MNEEWRPVEGYEGLYEVSNMGRVRSRYVRILSSTRLVNGYAIVCLSKNNIPVAYPIGRLVATAFFPDKTGKKKNVRYIDGDRTNNRADNLEWATRKTSQTSKTQMKRRRGRLPRAILVMLNGSVFCHYPSLTAAAQAFRVEPSTIFYACTHSGRLIKIPHMTFKFAEEEGK